MVRDELRAMIADECERIEEDAVHSGKGEFASAKLWRSFSHIVGALSAVGSALAGAAVIKNWNPDFAVISAVVGTVAGVLTATLKPGDEADRRHRAGNAFFAFKDRARVIRQVGLLSQAATEEGLSEQIRALSEDYSNARSSAPIVPAWSYWLAKRGVAKGQQTYEVDKRRSC